MEAALVDISGDKLASERTVMLLVEDLSDTGGCQARPACTQYILATAIERIWVYVDVGSMDLDR